MNQVNKLESLTFLRFIAAASVVVYHYGPDTILYSLLPSILKIGPLLVTFFFVLSGFVIAIANMGKQSSSAKFYVNRFARIFPIYALALVFYTLVTGGDFGSKYFFLPLTMLQAWIPGYALIGNAPSWSISVEVFFYLVAPALIILLNKKNSATPYSWLALSLAFLAATLAMNYILIQPPIYTGYPSASHDLVYYSPWVHFASLLLGFAGGAVYKTVGIKTKLSSFSKLGLFTISLLITNGLWVLAMMYTGYFGLVVAYSSSYFALPFLAVIYTSALANNILVRAPMMSFLVLLGESSYSLYILQMPMNIFVTKMIPASNFSSPDARFFFYFGCLTIASIMCYKLIEIPIGRAIKNAFNRLAAKPTVPEISAS